MPVVAVIVEVRICHVVAKLAVPDGFRLRAQVDAGLIERDRIERSQHSDIGKYRGIVLAVAVAVGRYIGYQGDVEARPAAYYRSSILCYSLAKHLRCIPVVVFDRIESARADTASAALT